MQCYVQVFYLRKMYFTLLADWLPEKHTNMEEKLCTPTPSLIAYTREKVNHRKDYLFRVAQIPTGQLLRQTVRTTLEAKHLPMVIYTYYTMQQRLEQLCLLALGTLWCLSMARRMRVICTVMVGCIFPFS